MIKNIASEIATLNGKKPAKTAEKKEKPAPAVLIEAGNDSDRTGSGCAPGVARASKLQGSLLLNHIQEQLLFGFGCPVTKVDVR